VRYEDLCEDVHDMLRIILSHAGLDIQSFPFYRCPPRLSNRNGPWIDAASSRELARVTQLQHELLMRHGYWSDPSESVDGRGRSGQPFIDAQPDSA
jgi:hypothetical protein